MLKILINAYACSPDMGSEPGMAWNWCVNLAKYCELEIITEGEFREKIEAVLPTLPQCKNMHFHYNPVPEKVRKMCWNQGDWRFYWYYRKWQKKTYQIALDIIEHKHIDVIHQLNMIGFREPGYLWKIKDIPFVWGPIGGMELMPTAYLEGTPLKVRLKVVLKNIINDYQRKHQPRVVAAIKRADALIAATKGAYDLILDYHHKDVVLINETGCYYNPEIEDTNHSDFNILWVGKFDFRKQLGLALKIISQLPDDVKVKLHIAGTGNEKVMAQYKQLATELNIADNVIWHGQVSHEEVQTLMRQSKLLILTSILEGTPHVVLESLQNDLPIICFDTCGQADVVDETIGIKIPLSNPIWSVKDFSEAIIYLYRHPEELLKMKSNCKKKQRDLTWEGKAERMVKIYTSAIKDKDDMNMS
jgi:glycosyltransferase involved in cell wall biosynthesis